MFRQYPKKYNHLMPSSILKFSKLVVPLSLFLFGLSIFCIIGLRSSLDKPGAALPCKALPASPSILQDPLNPYRNIALQHESNEKIPWIYAITPTFTRPVQKAELTRLCNTFINVPNLHWVVVEDGDNKTALVSNFLERCSVKYTHLSQGTPPEWKHREKEPHWKKPRGVFPRNAALQWLRSSLKDSITNGVVYFADDDNVYDLQLFEEMRYTKKVSVWPVGLAGGLMAEGPICSNNKVIGFNAGWKPKRPFPIDMAAFSININLILQNEKALFDVGAERGYQESVILSPLVTKDELEPKADSCTKVYVWHTRTETPVIKFKDKGPKMEV